MLLLPGWLSYCSSDEGLDAGLGFRVKELRSVEIIPWENM